MDYRWSLENLDDMLMRQFPEGYNTPEKWKGRQKAIGNLDTDKLRSVQEGLFCQTTNAFIKTFMETSF